PDLVGVDLGEPEVAVGARRDRGGAEEGGRDRELGDGVGRRVDHSDLVADDLGEPEVAVGTRRDPDGAGAGGRGGALRDCVGRRVCVRGALRWWVAVGVSLAPLLLAANSVTQRGASGPAAIPKSIALAVGMVVSVMAWVEESIDPILLPACSVNQRLPSDAA